MAAPLETYSVQFFLRLRPTRAERYPALRQPRQERRKPVSADRQRSISPPEPAWRRVTTARTLCSRGGSCFSHYKEARLCNYFAPTLHPCSRAWERWERFVPSPVLVPAPRNIHIRTIQLGDGRATEQPQSAIEVGAQNFDSAID